jgi:putative two-component system response regulator
MIRALKNYTFSRIMLVDDEITNLKLLTKALNVHGYENLEALQDPREVLSSYRKAKPDLILLDLNMPYLSGYDVLDLLRELEDPLLPPVVVLTAQKGQDYLLKAFRSGARDFITKPFDIGELIARVNNMLEVHTAHRLIHEKKEVLDDLVRVRTEELLHTRQQVIQKLGRAAEFRDNETGRHIIRVSRTAELLARNLDWSPDDCEALLHATPMHDIGKIGIPDKILLKPGKLDSEEWEIMKTHTIIGAHILEEDGSELLRLAQEIALTHHEKWDGSGYPRGLAGKDIPISGRIVAVADVFDALSSKRSYKDAWNSDRSIEHILSSGGSQFDPEIVDLFRVHLPEITDIQERLNDRDETAPAN